MVVDIVTLVGAQGLDKESEDARIPTARVATATQEGGTTAETAAVVVAVGATKVVVMAVVVAMVTHVKMQQRQSYKHCSVGM